MLRSLFLTLALTGCVGPTFIVQQFTGPERPRETISVLRVNGADKVRLLYLDDQDVAAPIATDSRLHIEMLPARHTVVVGNALATQERYEELAFDAKPGRVYRVIFTPYQPRVYEVDRETDIAVADVSVGRQKQIP